MDDLSVVASSLNITSVTYISVEYIRRIYSEIYVTDCLFADDQSVNKLSSYSSFIRNITNITYSSDYITFSQNNGIWGTLSPYIVNGSDDWCIEADYNSNKQYWGLGIVESSSKHIQCYAYADGLAPYDYGNNNRLFYNQGSASFNINTWYHIRVESKNGVVTISIYDDSDNLIDSGSFNMPSYYLDKTLHLGVSGFDNSTVKFRNVKIKPL